MDGTPAFKKLPKQARLRIPAMTHQALGSVATFACGVSFAGLALLARQAATASQHESSQMERPIQVGRCFRPGPAMYCHCQLQHGGR